MTTREFQLHIDPSLYGFKFKDANYATVKYGTEKVGENIIVELFEIGLAPTLLYVIEARLKLIQDAEAAAKKNAQAYWRNQPAEFLTGIIKGFAPHI